MYGMYIMMMSNEPVVVVAVLTLRPVSDLAIDGQVDGKGDQQRDNELNETS
jgi:hypothetical protein